ncbi:DUF1961 family protein [Fulvivirga sp. M361]|uniref:DUF1961 family protein n=1 Tax=Fulvivirga sp. M361 TaxID=2594266 RepID=UPI00117A31E5|nr:DUF1961 family protein [Fulvivirga sp. M361]TRX49042.1 DUF1961 family protein [Fulvivirga sp. M361]
MKLFLLLFTAFMYFTCQSQGNHNFTRSELLFEDTGTHNWKDQWMLDGERSQVINTPEGMELIAGPEHGNDTCHTVLWTKKVFEGNLLIEYDYTRTDTTTRCVNILYFLATGKGDKEHPEDISLWNDQRRVPRMKTYFNTMNTYHISYAAFGAKEFSGDNDYIRLRRYDPNGTGLNGTDVSGDIFKTGLFHPNETYHIKVIKFESQIEMHIQHKEYAGHRLICQWDVSDFPDCDNGRIGLRHMYTRSARYKNFKVWSIDK